MLVGDVERLFVRASLREQPDDEQSPRSAQAVHTHHSYRRKHSRLQGPQICSLFWNWFALAKDTHLKIPFVRSQNHSATGNRIFRKQLLRTVCWGECSLLCDFVDNSQHGLRISGFQSPYTKLVHVTRITFVLLHWKVIAYTLTNGIVDLQAFQDLYSTQRYERP